MRIANPEADAHPADNVAGNIASGTLRQVLDAQLVYSKI